jgi:inosine-uridine nucleoside N-ribohydrolase
MGHGWSRKCSITALAAGLLCCGCAPVKAQARYVIADQDVVSSADMALMLFLVSPEVHLLGITVVTGDGWREEEVAHALRLVEALGRRDVPVLAGAAFPLVRTAEETRLYDQLYGKPFYLGAYASPDSPLGWDRIDPANMPEGLPKTHAAEEDAAHWMVRMVHQHPHQVTIWAAGPLTNVALACRLDPHFAELAQQLVLMGGSLNPQTEKAEWVNRPRHEFNFWFDPEAASITLREKWANVTTTTIDVSLKTHAEPEVLDGLAKAHSPAAEWVTRYTPRPLFPNFLWDELAAAAWIDPTLITRERLVYMDVSTDHGPTYGDTLISTDADRPWLLPSRVHSITDVDLPRLQTMLIDRLSKQTPAR